MRCIRRIWYKFKLPFKSIWYDKKILSSNINEIVIFDALCNVDYLKWLRKMKPEAKIVFWYWNIVKNTISPNSIPDEIVEKWSFSRKDCAEYSMRFMPLPYFYELVIPPQNKEFDIVFVGKDKGRLSELLNLRSKFDKLGLKSKFIITPDHQYSKNAEYSNPISYLESLDWNSKAKAVLDYIEVDNSGQSLRVIEALFLKEKIITNSKLIYDYDFYCPENIFVLDRDDYSKLPSFLEIPYKNYDESIVSKYDFDAIINSLLSGNETVFDCMLKTYVENNK